MALYIRLESSFWNHRKILRLRALIGDAAFWVPPRLWCYAASNQPDGDFSDYSDEEIAMLVGYTGNAQAMLQALERVSLMDGRRIHDWEDHNSYHTIFAKRAKKAAKIRWQGHKRKRKDSTRQDKIRQEPSNPTSNPTSIPLEKKEKSRPKDRETVLEYVRSLGLPETDGHYYFDKWQAGGYLNGGKPIKDWQALIRSHKSAGYCPSQKQSRGPSAFQKPVSAHQEKLDREYEEARRLYGTNPRRTK